MADAAGPHASSDARRRALAARADELRAALDNCEDVQHAMILYTELRQVANRLMREE